MKRLFNVLAVFACTMLFTACEYYDHAITEHEDRLGQLENSYLKSVEEQLEGINTSLYHLEAIDTVLHALKDSLTKEFEKEHPLLPDDDTIEEEEEEENEAEEDGEEGGEEAIRRNAEKKNADLLLLITAEDIEFDQKVAELKNYIDSGIPATISTPQDWIEVTLTTMEQYIAVQTEVAKIKSLIRLHESEITTSYIDAFGEAISDCETSMKVWVNEALAENYYNFSAVDGELDILETKADSTNKALTEQIVAQQVALDTAKAHLTVAYEKAITEAIEENNGKISKEIANAVKEAQDALQSQIDVITRDIERIKAEILSIKEDIGIIQDDIATIGEQIEGINTSLDLLEEVDAALLAFIEELEAEAESLQEQLEVADSTIRADIQKELDNINAFIAALQTKDTELDQKIDELKAYVDNEISATADWAEATFATLEQYATMQTEIATLAALVEQYKQDLTNDYTAAIEAAVNNMQTAIETLETSMKAWVNETLTEGYYDIAAIDGMLEALETKLANADAALAKQIAAQQAALEQAKKDLTEAYEKAITEAIEENNGKISKEIADAVKTATDALEAKIAAINTEINAIKSEIANIKATIASINSQITNINASLTQLENVDVALQALIESLEKDAENLEKQLNANNTADAATKQALEAEITNIKTLIAALQAKDVELDKKIADLKTYVDNNIASIESWSKATFATLEQYVTMQTEIANLKALVETYKNNAVDTKAIEAAIAASETSMKAWVNRILADGYYDIATIEAKLATLAAAANNYTDQQLNKAIANQQAALEQAKAELTAAYQKAIQDAITNNNGNSSGNFETQIAAAKAELQNQINAINTQLTVIENRLDALEDRVDALETRIQSIRFVPEYSDGKVDLSSGQATLTFILTPYEAASVIAQEYQNSKGVITAYISRTKTRTRAIDTPQTLTITSVTGNANGILEIGINTNSLPSNYWDDMTSANVYIRINDGNNDIVSEMIPAFESLPTTTTVEMVDLGLSVKWASCNVGASSPESYGSYYTWEETKSIEWSDGLRMPTAEEMKELREQCTWKWTKTNGVYGYRISRNGNSIFLPASGFHLNNRAFDSGEYGYYWATGSNNQANVLEFNVDNYDYSAKEPTYSCTVRPVSK